ncbi:hypothetical protein RND81_09G042300 [Saponaria officinalis]|uniref:F-box domain-containing protein n=1 Tax=Saponaria officinalis TaxID=3572 RepID=A0AAW1II73_SAPOF
MSTWLDKFPSDVRVDMLKRMDSRSLLRLMSSCKSMFSLYRDTKRNFNSIKEVSSISVDVTYFLLGSIYGLVCFAKTFHPYDYDIILWNPFLVKNLTLPIPVETCERSCAIGFGFDHHCLDYKADVYVVRAGEWKKVIVSISRPASTIVHGGGIIKFTQSSQGQSCEEYSLLTYNLSTDLFSEMGIEEIMEHKFMSLTKLTFNGEEKLVLYHDDQYYDFYVWVMEEYGVVDSWREIYILGYKSHDEYIKVLHRKNGEIVFSTTQGGMLSCGIEGDIYENTNVKVIKDYGLQFEYIGPFVTSLVSVEQHFHMWLFIVFLL